MPEPESAAERTTRGGRVFNPYVLRNAIFVPRRRIFDLVKQRAEGESDSESDTDDDEGDAPEGLQSVHDVDSRKSAKGKRKARGDPPTSSPGPSKRPRNATREDLELEASAVSTSNGAFATTRKPVAADIADAHLLSPAELAVALKKRKKALAHRTRRNEWRTQNQSGVSTAQKGHTRPVASTGWMGLRDTVIQGAADREAPDSEQQFHLPEARAYTLDEVMHPSLGMHLVDWDGVPAPLVDEDRYVFAVLAGAPRDPKWQQDVAEPAAALMEEAAQEIYGEPFYAEVFGRRKHTKRKKDGTRSTPANEKDPRRGSHHSKNVGSSMGGGPDEPTAFYNSVINALILAQLLAAKPFQRIAGFINKMFYSYSPDLHDHYRTTMAELHRWKDSLPRNFSALTSVFAAATFNFGPRTVTLPHLDFANLAWGWCSITALGYFDPNKGGHLILWDLRLVIRFPPGSSILIPSAILRHSNVAIQQGEKRFSFTQYTAAGIFRFVGNGFRTEKSLNARMTAAEQAKRAEERRCRFTEGIKMYKKWDVAFE
ncbi:hypothetical protein B0H11DRAFT_1948400 [Mycena galericulata]|nr:hypothetical protein B0H11DRAFT_1948400 [Mycena galericulata]